MLFFQVLQLLQLRSYLILAMIKFVAGHYLKVFGKEKYCLYSKDKNMEYWKLPVIRSHLEIYLCILSVAIYYICHIICNFD